MNLDEALKNLNPEQLKQHINTIDPVGILKQLGVSDIDAQNILSGDTSSIETFAPDILDYHLIIERFKDAVNVHLIKYFFKKALNKEAFTNEEIEAYAEAYNHWFDLVFRIGKYSIFQLSPEMNDQSLLIKKDNDFFQMTIFEDIRQINYIGKDIKF